MAAAMTDTINNNNQCIPSIESLSIASPSPSLSSPLIPRTIDTIVTARETAEGLGARVRRVIGGGQIDSLDPFLLFDHAIINANAGFPDHPHRGFETVSYALPWSKGTMIHEDFTGKKGEEKAGDVQWMTAGRGIVHSEIPLGDGVCEGIQIWVNLPAKDKMIKPYYQDFKANQIPTIKQNGIEVRVISGESMGTKASTRTLTPVYYLHITMESNKRMEQSIPTDYNCIIYVLKGSIFIGRDANDGKENPEEKISQYQAVTMVHKKSSIIDNGKQGGVIIRSFGGGEASFLLLAGQPLNEPIARYGPFVMNSQQQIMEAFRDYQNGKGGFEKAKGWKSTIGTKFQQRYYEKKNKKGKKKGKTRGDSDSDDNDDY